jgi:hypothetical protein
LRLTEVRAKTIFVSARWRKERSAKQDRGRRKAHGDGEFRQAVAPVEADAQRRLQAQSAGFE